MHNDSYEDEAPDQYARDYGLGGNDDSYPYYPMPLWAKAVVIIAVIASAKILYELVQGNRAVMILLGFAIPIIGFSLWHSYRSEREHVD